MPGRKGALMEGLKQVLTPLMSISYHNTLTEISSQGSRLLVSSYHGQLFLDQNSKFSLPRVLFLAVSLS